MFTPIPRFVLAFLSLLGGILTIQRGEVLPGVGLLSCGILFATGYYLNGTVYLAFRRLKNEDAKATRRLLAQNPRPEWLLRSPRAYYFFMVGVLEIESGRFREAILPLQKSLQLGLRTEHDAALAKINLALVWVELSEPEKARKELGELQKLDWKPVLRPELEKLEQRLRDYHQ